MQPQDPTQFTRESAERIGRVVRAAELSVPQTKPLSFDRVDVFKNAKVFRMGTFTGAWSINSAHKVTFRNVTSTPNTATAINLFTDFTQSTAARTCAIAKDGTAWYLVAPSGIDGGKSILSKTGPQWAYNTTQTLTVYSGPPGNETPEYGNTLVACNKWADIPPDEWVMVASSNGTYYVSERPNDTVLCQTPTKWYQDTGKLLNVYKGQPPYESPDGSQIYAWNKWGAIDAGEWVLCSSVNGIWYVVERPNYGQVFVGTYQGTWSNGGATKTVTVRINNVEYPFTVSNWLTPISGTGGKCVFAMGQDGWTLLNFDLTKLNGYTGGTQVLGSEGGALKWFDTVICT